MDWQSRDIETFISVCETCNFTTTARALGIAQSAVSRTIANLEKQLGFQLLTRNTRGMVPTAAGALLCSALTETAQSLRRAGESARAVAEGAGGQLRLGIDPNFSLQLIPQLLVTYARDYPEIGVTVIPMDSGRQRQHLQAGAIDAAIMLGAFGGSGLASRVLTRLPVFLVVPKVWKCEPSELSWDQLRALPRMAGPDDTSITFERILAVAADPAGGLGTPRHIVGHPRDAFWLMGQGGGYLFHAGEPVPLPPDVASAEAVHLVAPLAVSLAWRRSESASPAFAFATVAIDSAIASG